MITSTKKKLIPGTREFRTRNRIPSPRPPKLISSNSLTWFTTWQSISFHWLSCYYGIQLLSAHSKNAKVLHWEYTNAPLMQRRQEGKKKNARSKTGWRMHKAEVPFKSSEEVNSFSGRQSGNSCPAATRAQSTKFSNWKWATYAVNQKHVGPSLWTTAIGEKSALTWSNCGIAMNITKRCFWFQDAGRTSSRALITAWIITWFTKTLMQGLANTDPLCPFVQSSS